MRTDGPNRFSDAETRIEKQQTTRESSSAQPKRGTEDRLELSVSSQQLDDYRVRVQDAPEIRAEKVEEIRNELSKGTYNIRAEEVAESIIKGAIINKRA